MEMKLSCLFVLLVVGFSSAAPAPEKSNATDDVELVPLGGRRQHNIPNFPGFSGFPDITGDQDGGYPDSFFSSMHEMIKRLRQQMSVLLGAIPAEGEGAGGGFPGFGFAPPSFGHVDLGKGNTTSVTKVINGHKVVINETTYGDADASGGTFFKVRVIDVKPDGDVTEKSTETPTTAAPSKDRDVEPIENSAENEINQASEYRKHRESLEEFDYDEAPWDDLDAVESIADNGITDKRGPVYDLSGDTYVNKLKEEAGAPFNPDAEFIDFRPNTEFGDFVPRQPYRSAPRAEFNSFEPPQPYRPYDYSRDTYVNKLKEDAGAPFNPDAELIDLDPDGNVNGLLPKKDNEYGLVSYP